MAESQCGTWMNIPAGFLDRSAVYLDGGSL